MIDPFADVVATLAFLVALLSGLPRIIAVFRRPALGLVSAQRCYVQHYCGRTQVYLFLDILNKGGRSTTIDSITAILRQGKQAWKLSALSYTADDLAARMAQLVGQNRELLFGSVTLRPDEHWRGNLDAYDYPDESDEKKYNELYVQMDDDIAAKKKNAPTPAVGEQAPLIDVDPDLVKIARNYFESNFGLAAGPYQLFIAVSFEGGRHLCIKGYTLTLYDANEKDLLAIADDYIYGISYAHSRGAKLPVRLSVMNDNQARAEYDQATRLSLLESR